MPDEFDPTLDLGLPPDRFAIVTCRGFLTRHNDARILCEEYIENGRNFFDVLERYDMLTSYVLNREDATSGSYYKWCVPFLKAFGTTDHSLYKTLKDRVELMPNASRTMKYISDMLPTYITTESYEHGMMEVMDRLNAPLCDMSCTNLCMDQSLMGRVESRNVREVSKKVSCMTVPKKFYELNVPTELYNDDIEIIRTLDQVITNEIPEAGAMSLMESTEAMTSHKKAYRMLDVRRLTGIDLNNVMYIGSASTDFQPMDLVRDSSGLSIAYNGEEFAVRGCNVAILSEDTTVASLFAQMFTDKGPLAAYELAKNWSREYLENMSFPDVNLIRTFLREHPDELPKVYAVDDSNVDKVSKESDKFRKKLLGD